MQLHSSRPGEGLIVWGIVFVTALAAQVLIGDEVRGFVDGLYAGFIDGV